ncbi:MAG: hypothetical protein SGBAC_010909 [Bacillariaceae sp.]
MKINVPLSSFLVTILASSMTMMIMMKKSDALLMRNNNFSTRHTCCHPSKSIISLANSFEQLPGESDIDFIERITTNSKELLEEQSSAASIDKQQQKQQQDEEPQKKKKGKYQRIEEWDAERNTSGELTWEERVMFDGQRHGNQVRQNDILNRNLHSW